MRRDLRYCLGMPNAKTQPPLPHVQCGTSIATEMIGHLVSRLEVEAAKSGGQLSGEAIRGLSQRFLNDELRLFKPAFQRNYDECTQRREAVRWSGIRKQPFDRLLVKRFAHLFPPRDGDDGGLGLLSRRIIPGFSVAIDKMIGPMLYEQCQLKTRSIMDRHTQGANVDWNAVYADADALLLANDVLLVVAHYFAEFDRRRAWFLELINNHLSEPMAEDNNDFWQLGNHGFSEMMRALFQSLSVEMVKHPAQLKKRYGEHTINALAEFLRQLSVAV